MSLVVLGVAPGAGNASRVPRKQPKVLPAKVCNLPTGSEELPASALRGLINHLQQYPSIALATRAQRRSARALLAVARQVARKYADPRRARRAGYSTKTASRKKGDVSPHYFHAEHKREWASRRRVFDPRRPKALIYVNEPGRPLILVGAMYSVKRGERGPSPGGPITRWHSHSVCVRGSKRGVRPLDDGDCPRGAKKYQGSEMMHIWFTRDLRSAFAVRAPEPEMCRDRLLTARACRNTSNARGM